MPVATLRCRSAVSAHHPIMQCLIIDNYDSFTWNLAHYAAQVFGTEPIVVRNNQWRWDDLRSRLAFDCIIISPGPGNVVNDDDFGISRDAVTQAEIPVLGVCLGMQGMAYAHGATIVHAPTPYHGRASQVTHHGDELFAGIPNPFRAIRYHSLMVDPAVPNDIRITATADPGIIMGIRHQRLPQWGVQFHPESILTEHGRRLIQNFRDLAHQHCKRTPMGSPAAGRNPTPPAPPPSKRGATRRHIVARKIATPIDPESVFLTLYGQSKHAFWLDSANAAPGYPGFSFMGEAQDHHVRTYRLANDGEKLEHGQRFLADLEDELERISVAGGDDLPFAFRGGWIGYLTYEMKALFGAQNAHHNTLPDALWMRADRFIAIDHGSGAAWVVCVSDEHSAADANQWAESCCQHILQAQSAPPPPPTLNMQQIDVQLNLSHDDYLAAIAQCLEAIHDGESYEVCLTNQFSIDININPLDLYRALRHKNPAPFAAYLRSGATAVLSSSPEQFLNVDRHGRVRTRPIKGTRARAPDPKHDLSSIQSLAHSEKDRAENLMIVDLMRNDLSRVSTVGSVSAPRLMDVETFATVHQMVSTVESQLKPAQTLIDLLRATFPGGSISGAPKLRTLDIIDRLERAPRGVYCGAIGYLGYNRVADLNVAIRTLCYDGSKISYGAGGAITYLSDPEQEFEEVITKSNAVLNAIWSYAGDAGHTFCHTLDGNRMRVSSPRQTPG